MLAIAIFCFSACAGIIIAGRNDEINQNMSRWLAEIDEERL